MIDVLCHSCENRERLVITKNGDQSLNCSNCGNVILDYRKMPAQGIPRNMLINWIFDDMNQINLFNTGYISDFDNDEAREIILSCCKRIIDNLEALGFSI